MDGSIDLDLERQKWRSHDVQKKAHLIVTAGDDRRRQLVGSLSLHPVGHVLPPHRHGIAQSGEHLLRDGDLQHRLQGVFTVEIRAQSPHRVSLFVFLGLHFRFLWCGISWRGEENRTILDTEIRVRRKIRVVWFSCNELRWWTMIFSWRESKIGVAAWRVSRASRGRVGTTELSCQCTSWLSTRSIWGKKFEIGCKRSS